MNNSESVNGVVGLSRADRIISKISRAELNLRVILLFRRLRRALAVSSSGDAHADEGFLPLNVPRPTTNVFDQWSLLNPRSDFTPISQSSDVPVLDDLAEGPINQNPLRIDTSSTGLLGKAKDFNAGPRSPLMVPKELESFAISFKIKYAKGLFLGSSSTSRESNQRAQFSYTRCMSKSVFMREWLALEPTEKALQRTREAATAFFDLAFKLLSTNDLTFPLAGLNKCLGVVAVPRSKLVIIAISQDKNPASDELLRSKMVSMIQQLNTLTQAWVFELACIPTKAQYLMPRTFFMRTPHAAPQEWVEPHTRCVEVSLMAALCKAGRTKPFHASEAGIVAFGSTLWASENGLRAMRYFEGKEDSDEVTRNLKYRTQRPIAIPLPTSTVGWIDVWDPCKGHCAIYKREMYAIGAAGGPGTSFFEPRSEWARTRFIHHQTNQNNTALDRAVSSSAISAP